MTVLSAFDSFAEKYNLQNLVTVKSYNYNNLLLGYGPNKEVTVNIFWCTEAMEFKMVNEIPSFRQ